MARPDEHETTSEPRKVKLKRRDNSFGFKVRGQAVRGGPRWLINGHEYRNLQTVSDVIPESPAEEGGVLPGDRILSINNIELEDVDHNEFKEVMKSAGDELELVVVTPLEVKMLDIPVSVVIHKADGSCLTINEAELLHSHTIDEALQSEKDRREEKVEIQVHKAEESGNLSEVVVIPNNDVLEEAIEVDGSSEESLSNESLKTDEAPSEDLIEKDDEIGTMNEEKQAVIEIVDEENTVCDVYIGDVGDTDTTVVEILSDCDACLNNQSEDSIEQTTTVELFDGPSDDSIQEQQTEDSSSHNETPSESCGPEGNDCEEPDISPTSIVIEAGSLTKGSTFITLKRDDIRNPHEKEVKVIQHQMRLMLSTMKHQKVRPFSPDISSDLSPYHSNKCIQDYDNARRSWKISQRPTTFSVLHPTESLRLESPQFENDLAMWSSNLSKERNTVSVPPDHSAGPLRRDVMRMYQAYSQRKPAYCGYRTRSSGERKINNFKSRNVWSPTSVNH